MPDCAVVQVYGCQCRRPAGGGALQDSEHVRNRDLVAPLLQARDFFADVFGQPEKGRSQGV